MPESTDASSMLEHAEQAANAGDLVSADRLLREVARIQEAELGPLHPELANTLNNLAIVAERTGRPRDAEQFYRRAAAIAAESLPPNHPAVAASRQNLEDFCFASGLPIDAPAFMPTSAREAELGLGAFAPEAAENAADASPAASEMQEVATEAAPPPEKAPAPTPLTDAPPADAPLMAVPPADHHASEPIASRPLVRDPVPERPRGVSRSPGLMAMGVALLLSAALLATRAWSPRDTSNPPQTATPPEAAAPAAPPAAEPSIAPAPTEPAPAPNVAPPANDRTVASDEPVAPAPSASGLSLATVQLCQSFSPTGGNWRCDAIGDAATPGQIAFYTRVRSARDAVIVHQWYRGDTLVKSVKLTIRASAKEGYRTFSRQMVDGDDSWRVELRSADGDLLHEQRFAVR